MHRIDGPYVGSTELGVFAPRHFSNGSRHLGRLDAAKQAKQINQTKQMQASARSSRGGGGQERSWKPCCQEVAKRQKRLLERSTTTQSPLNNHPTRSWVATLVDIFPPSSPHLDQALLTSGLARGLGRGFLCEGKRKMLVNPPLTTG